jgi:hypothetical protein
MTIPWVERFSVQSVWLKSPKQGLLKGVRNQWVRRGCYTKWMKVAYPSIVLKHKQCQSSTTSEPRTLNPEPLQGILWSIQRLKPIHKALIFKLNDIIHQLHHLPGHRAGCFKFPILQARDRLDFYTRMTGENFVGV